MEFNTIKLRDLTVLITKGTTSSNIGEVFTDSGIMYFRSELIGKSKYIDKSSGLLFISNETHNKLKRSQLLENDILFSMAGVYLGKISIVGKDDFPANTNQAVALIRFKENSCNVDYVYYYMRQKWFNEYVCSLTAQAAQPNINLDQIGKLKINLPSHSTQVKIASILSSYDNLIENNNKRIHLLKQMAGNLYKDWFVRFRFPGHENAEFENGLPKGWNKSSLSAICVFKRGKNITSDEMCEGNIPVISAGIDASGYHNKANVNGISVTMSSSGANAGYISIHYTDVWAADCSYIEESTTPNIYYVYEMLNNMRVIITNFQRGAAQPHVYPRDINRIKLIVPNIELMDKANKLFAVIHQEIHHLQQQSNLLSRQRDLLLPRLMSGKLEV